MCLGRESEGNLGVVKGAVEVEEERRRVSCMVYITWSELGAGCEGDG